MLKEEARVCCGAPGPKAVDAIVRSWFGITEEDERFRSEREEKEMNVCDFPEHVELEQRNAALLAALEEASRLLDDGASVLSDLDGYSPEKWAYTAESLAIGAQSARAAMEIERNRWACSRCYRQPLGGYASTSICDPCFYCAGDHADGDCRDAPETGGEHCPPVS